MLGRTCGYAAAEEEVGKRWMRRMRVSTRSKAGGVKVKGKVKGKRKRSRFLYVEMT